MSIAVEVGLLSGKTATVQAGRDETVQTLSRRAQIALGAGNGRLLDASGVVLDGSQVIIDTEIQNGSSLTLHVLRVQVQASGVSFAAILGDGSVVTWGDADWGGDSSAVQGQLKNVQQIQATATSENRHGAAMAAILADGSVVTWGHDGSGGDSRAVQRQLKNVQQVQASCYAFAAILGDGSVVTWGHDGSGGDSSAVQGQLTNVHQVQASCYAFAAILGDGSVVTWGDPDYGGDSSSVQGRLTNVRQVQASCKAFAAILGDGSVVTWGDADWGGDSSAVQGQLKNVQQLQASGGVWQSPAAVAAILADGSVVTWGHDGSGGDSRAVQRQLKNVQQVQAYDYAFAAILGDGSVVTWGHPDLGGDSSSVQGRLKNVQQVQASCSGFAAILGDGSVVTWGHAGSGGDSSAVQGQLTNVHQVQASCGAFAAILGDGSVVTWGDPDYGGDSSSVQGRLKNVRQVQGSFGAFAAILGDGSVVTWGDADCGGDSSAVAEVQRETARALCKAFGGSAAAGDDGFRGATTQLLAQVTVAEALSLAREAAQEAPGMGESWTRNVLKLGQERHSDAYRRVLERRKLEAAKEASGATTQTGFVFCFHLAAKPFAMEQAGTSVARMARRALAAALALAVAGSDPEPARRLQFVAEDGGWMRIGEDDQQCYVPGGMDIHEGKSREYCRKKADEAGWEYYQYNEDKELCAMTDMCEKSAMTFDATGWKSYGKALYLLVSLTSDVYALKALSQHRQGNIIMSAWHKLGYVSAEELGKLRFDGDMDAFAASMSHVQGSMRTLLNLGVLPDLGLDAAAKDLDSSIFATALQAKRHVWWIHDEADRCLPLPSWTNRPLELVLMAWVKERQGWDRLLHERGDKGLTAQQQAKYAAWSGKPQRDAKKGIIMLSLSLSMVPEELRILSQNCWKPLFVRQYVEGEAHPEASVIPGCVQIKPPEVLEPELAEEKPPSAKNWCVRCGESLWVPKRKPKQCCESNCFAHYWWTPYGATVDCGGGNLTVSLAEAQTAAQSHV
eukprot:s1336_g4.t1